MQLSQDGQRLSKHVPAETDTNAIIEDYDSYVLRVELL
jgi:hypothetical protein